MIKLIYPDTVDEEVFKSDKPVLLAFLKPDGKLAGRIRSLYAISQNSGDWLKVCLGDFHCLGNFFNLLQFHGTPIYFVYCDGMEQNRFFGHAETEDLNRFVLLSMPGSFVGADGK